MGNMFDELNFKVNLSVADNNVKDIYDKLLKVACDCDAISVLDFPETLNEYQLVCNFEDFAVVINMTHDNYDINITTTKGFNCLWKEYSSVESLKNLSSDLKVKKIVDNAWDKQREINKKIQNILS